MNRDGLLAYVGRLVGVRKMDYTWRDHALYALAVGANEKELEYTYEKEMKPLPTFMSAAYWNGQFQVTPQRPAPYSPYTEILAYSERDLGKWPGGTHMEHELEVIRPFDPIKGSFILKDKIRGIYDRGEGKGVMVGTETEVYDEAGRLLAINRGGHLLSAYGGFGGEKVPKQDVQIPEDREPDYVIEDYITPTQNLLYRLTSDTLPAHVDQEYAESRGWKAPIMQGLCNQGFAARMLIGALCKGQPERLKRIYVQFRSFCYIGTKIKLAAWKDGEGRVVFRMLDAENGTKILDKGIFEYR